MRVSLGSGSQFRSAHKSRVKGETASGQLEAWDQRSQFLGGRKFGKIDFEAHLRET